MSSFGLLRRRLRRVLLRVAGRVLRRSQRQLPTRARRILVIKPDNLGDVLLLTPALQLLRQQRPDAHITLLVGPWSTLAVAHNPNINTILTCAFPGFARSTKGTLLQPYWLLFKMALLLRAGRFDVALIARDDHWWGALLAALAGIPHRIGYAVPETQPFLTQALPHSFADHVSAQNIALVEALTGQSANPAPTMTPPISDQDRAWAGQWLRSNGAPSSSLIAIHPGAGGAAKLWLAERWTEVANTLHEQGYTVLLTGGVTERDLVQMVAQGMLQRPLMLVGEATVGQLAALYQRCSMVLGVDSGPLHLAVAAGAPTLALFGPGDAGRFGPWGNPKQHIVLHSGLWCSPCGVLDACPRGTAPSECMTLIKTPQVFAALEQLRLSQL